MSKQKSAEKLAGFNGAADQIDSLTQGIPETREGAGRGGTDPKIYPSSWFYMSKQKSAEKLVGFDGAADQINIVWQ